jgi:hypothetical protein
MACNWVENIFNENESLVVTIDVGGTSATLRLQNTGRNILDIRRILLGYVLPGGAGGVLYLRPPGLPITWSHPRQTLEQGTGFPYYTLTGLPAGTIVQAQAEYTEVQARARSCQFGL